MAATATPSARSAAPGHHEPVLESATYSARQTELAWTFPHGPGGADGPLGRDAVWEALAAAVDLRGLGLLSADRSLGLLLAKPPFSLANMGRRVVLTLTRRPEGTLVRATSLHGLLCLQGRSARMALLEDLLHTAWRLLERAAAEAREAQQAQDAEEDAGSGNTREPAPAPHAGAGRPAGQGPRKAPPVPDYRHTPWEDLPLEAPSAPAPADAPAPPAAPAATAPEPAPAGPHPTHPAPVPDYRHTPWEDLPLEAPPPEARRAATARPARSGPGIRRSLLWFLVGTVLAVGAVFLLGLLGR